MQGAYGIDLRRALWGAEPVGLRRLASLVNGLPPGGALDRALDPEGWGANWHHAEELLAMIAELLDRDWRQTVAMNSKRGATKPRPLRIPRPGDVRRRAAKIRNPDGWEIRRFLESKGLVRSREESE